MTRDDDYMSDGEKKFIGTYVAALRRDFYLLQDVVELMTTDDMPELSVVRAVNMATELHHIHASFETKLRALPRTASRRRWSHMRRRYVRCPRCK